MDSDGDAVAGLCRDRARAGAAPRARHGDRAQRHCDEYVTRGRAGAGWGTDRKLRNRLRLPAQCGAVPGGRLSYIMRWRLEPKPSVLPGERFIGAMRVGFQYVVQSTSMRAVLVRVAIFFLQSTALLALLPLVAKNMPGGNAWTYTLLLASLGTGAIATAFLLPRLRVLISRERLLRDGALLQAVAMVAAGFAPNVWSAMPAMMLAGAAWLAVVNTLTVASQLSLPDWVRARGMSIYMMTMMGIASASAAVWGQVASLIPMCRGPLSPLRRQESRCGCQPTLACGACGSAGSDAGANSEGADACVSGRAPNGAGHGDRGLSD